MVWPIFIWKRLSATDFEEHNSKDTQIICIHVKSFLRKIIQKSWSEMSVLKLFLRIHKHQACCSIELGKFDML